MKSSGGKSNIDIRQSEESVNNTGVYYWGGEGVTVLEDGELWLEKR
jgi:hypothetical protein